MTKYISIGLLLCALVVTATSYLFYKTPLPIESAIQTQSADEFGGFPMNIEFATTTVAREKGLSGRKILDDDYGMLFVFPRTDRYGFWMKDMRVPIDIFWLDNQGHVISIDENVATSTYPRVFYPSAPARYVLETASGFAKEHQINIGSSLVLQSWPSVLQ